MDTSTSSLRELQKFGTERWFAVKKTLADSGSSAGLFTSPDTSSEGVLACVISGVPPPSLITTDSSIFGGVSSYSPSSCSRSRTISSFFKRSSRFFWDDSVVTVWGYSRWVKI